MCPDIYCLFFLLTFISEIDYNDDYMLEVQKLLKDKTLLQEVAKRLNTFPYRVKLYARENARFNSKMRLLENINDLKKTNYTILDLYKKVWK